MLKAAAGAALLAGLVWYVDIHALIASVRTARIDFLAAGAGLAAVNVGLQFARWKFLLRLIRVPASNASVFASLSAGFTAGFFTPGQIGEIGGRLFGLDARYRASVLSMSAVDKLYVLGATIASGTLSALMFFPLFLPAVWGIGLTVASYGLLGAVAAGFLFPSLTKSLLERLPQRIRSHRLFGAVTVFETDFTNASGQTLTLLTAALFGVIILQYHCFVNAFTDAPLTASALCVPIVLFVKSIILPISIGDLGIRESASVFFYTRAGVTAAASLNASLCVFTVNIVVPALLGISALFTSHKR